VRTIFNDELWPGFPLGLARSAVAQLRDGNTNAHAVLARRHSILHHSASSAPTSSETGLESMPGSQNGL
jgi:hypothetical protein